MKKTIRLSLLLAIYSVTAFINPLKAQDVTKELLDFTTKFEAAYNKHDDKALKAMYAMDATRVGQDGNSITGNELIRVEFAKQFTDNSKIMIEIKQETATSETDGSATATGTYHVTGTNNGGEKIEINGKYTNTVVKVKGHWKISKSVLEKI